MKKGLCTWSPVAVVFPNISQVLLERRRLSLDCWVSWMFQFWETRLQRKKAKEEAWSFALCRHLKAAKRLDLNFGFALGKYFIHPGRRQTSEIFWKYLWTCNAWITGKRIKFMAESQSNVQSAKHALKQALCQQYRTNTPKAAFFCFMEAKMISEPWILSMCLRDLAS